MYNYYNPYHFPYIPNGMPSNLLNLYNPYMGFPYFFNPAYHNFDFLDSNINQKNRLDYMNYLDPCFIRDHNLIDLKDYGPNPFVVDIEDAAKQNKNFRTTLWTGKYLQVTLMSINIGDDIGLEIHKDTDQFLRIEDGEGLVKMGVSKDNLSFQKKVSDDDAILVPAGTWHNVINTGRKPLKLYSIYAPPHHKKGTIHETKAIAEAEEDH